MTTDTDITNERRTCAKQYYEVLADGTRGEATRLCGADIEEGPCRVDYVGCWCGQSESEHDRPDHDFVSEPGPCAGARRYHTEAVEEEDGYLHPYDGWVCTGPVPHEQEAPDGGK